MDYSGATANIRCSPPVSVALCQYPPVQGRSVENRPSVRCACASEGAWSMFYTFPPSAPRIASYGVGARSAFTIAPSTIRRMNNREPGTATASFHQPRFFASSTFDAPVFFQGFQFHSPMN